jgi:hypothetical protein
MKKKQKTLTVRQSRNHAEQVQLLHEKQLLGLTGQFMGSALNQTKRCHQIRPLYKKADTVI